MLSCINNYLTLEWKPQCLLQEFSKAKYKFAQNRKLLYHKLPLKMSSNFFFFFKEWWPKCPSSFMEQKLKLRVHYETEQYESSITFTSVSHSRSKLHNEGFLVWNFLHHSPGNSHSLRQLTLLCFFCCCGDKVVLFVPCIQVRLHTVSYYHGSLQV